MRQERERGENSPKRQIFCAYSVNTGNWETANDAGLSVALDVKRTQSPVSKLTDWHVAFLLQWFRHSVSCRVPGLSSIVSDGALYT